MRGEWDVFAQWMMFDFNTTFIPFERKLKTGGCILESDFVRFPVFCLFNKDRTGLCFSKEMKLIF